MHVLSLMNAIKQQQQDQLIIKSCLYFFVSNHSQLFDLFFHSTFSQDFLSFVFFSSPSTNPLINCSQAESWHEEVVATASRPIVRPF